MGGSAPQASQSLNQLHCSDCQSNQRCPRCKACPKCNPIRDCRYCLQNYQPNVRIKLDFEKIHRMYAENLRIISIQACAVIADNRQNKQTKNAVGDFQHLIVKMQVEYPKHDNPNNRCLISVDAHRGSKGRTEGKVVACIADLTDSQQRHITNTIPIENGKGIRDLYSYLMQNLHGKKSFDLISYNCCHFARDVFQHLAPINQQVFTAVKKIDQQKDQQIKKEQQRRKWFWQR